MVKHGHFPEINSKKTLILYLKQS
eukprot:COSAG05_NODE_22815_length_262_cov_0.631902_1_plen_23_part_10